MKWDQIDDWYQCLAASLTLDFMDKEHSNIINIIRHGNKIS